MTLDTDPTPRRVLLERVFNFRDLGGYAAGDRTVRWGRLYRADGIHRLDGDDIARVAALGIRTVVDLRTRNEVTEHGSCPVDGFDATYHHLPLIERVWERQALDTEQDPVQFLADRYLDMLDQGSQSIVNALTIVADPERLPLVFHCAAGKDRTGVFAAVLLGVLGLDDADIAADYGLSGAAMQELAEWVRTERPESYEVMAAQPATFLEAPPLAMQRFLDLARAEHGSMADYLVGIGLPVDTIAALRAGLLTP